MKRTDLLNHLVEKHELFSYLEIGVQVPELNFDKIKCPYKIGVDPDPQARATIQKTSDEYFQFEINQNQQFPNLQKKYDLIFLDGLHTAEQVKKDFENALKVLSPNGYVVLHDCNPEKEEHTIVPRPTKTGHWNGDVYKFACEIGVYFHKFNVVDIDNGCGVWNNAADDLITNKTYFFPPAWEYFDKNRKELLNLISWNEFIKL